MPEMGEMYCSQQICIPPTFPYLLRQFAKAAIRTQPNDLLKWSTTYFRCLSLNIPPPVKPRLEYPIPRDHHGMTPGWLKALLHQMEGAHTVPFKVLWDRWIGACLQHHNLIQILCLGGFDDNMAVPWLRFIGLCAAHLTDNLTQSMILICEILTEEPEGGSAMVPVDVFIDLYQFLARIDASIPQTLRNYYFLDKFLELYQERIARDQGLKQVEEVSEEAPVSTVTSEASMKTEKETRKDDGGSIVSCPSVSSQDPDNFMKLLMKIREGDEEDLESAMLPQPMQDDIDQDKSSKSSKKVDDEDQKKSEKSTEAEPDKTPQKKERRPSKTSQKSGFSLTDQEDSISRETKLSQNDDDNDEENEGDATEDKYLIEDLERLKMVQHELMGAESDDELEKFKASIVAEAGLTASQMEAPEHFQEKIGEVSTESLTETVKSDESTVTAPSVKSEEKVDYEDVYVDAVPGIGPIVPEKLIANVCTYMREAAKWQHGMVMPRNIRHFECPPLEITDSMK